MSCVRVHFTTDSTPLVLTDCLPFTSALTITHISDVSGIGDDIEEGALNITAEEDPVEDKLEEGDLPTLEEGDLMVTKAERKSDSSSSSASSSSSSSSSGEEREKVPELESGLLDDIALDSTRPGDTVVAELENRVKQLEEEIERFVRDGTCAAPRF